MVRNRALLEFVLCLKTATLRAFGPIRRSDNADIAGYAERKDFLIIPARLRKKSYSSKSNRRLGLPTRWSNFEFATRGEKMKFPLFKGLSLGLVVLGLSSVSNAGTPASPQATPVPLNLPVIGNVQVTGSDSRSSTFNSQWLPKFQTIINDNLSESVVFTNATGFRLDSSKLFLRQECVDTIRVTFLAEGAGYRNTLGFAFTPAGSATPGTPKVIFPNASIGSGARTVNTPLRAGDFVEIGKGGNGWQLDFFLISDAFNKWRDSGQTNTNLTWLWNDIAKNSDAIQHVVAFAMPNSPYILIGFEDLVGGGDLDYNDALFVVDIGMVNATSLTDDPSSLPQ